MSERPLSDEQDAQPRSCPRLPSGRDPELVHRGLEERCVALGRSRTARIVQPRGKSVELTDPFAEWGCARTVASILVCVQTTMR